MLKVASRFLWPFLVLIAAISVPTRNRAAAQEPPPAPSDPFVIESFETSFRYETNGMGTREIAARIHIQSDAALREFGLWAFAYAHDLETLDILYVRVRKPDGSVTATPATDVQDLSSDITREAPMYTDQREKHIPVKSLSVGDTIEYAVRWTTTHPVAPGNYWMMDNFIRQGTVLQETLTIDLPKDSGAKVFSSKFTPSVTEKGDRKLYVFHSSHSGKEPESKDTSWEQMVRPAPAPDVQVSSFASWDDVGKWYGSLQKPQLKVTPEICGKAEELVRGKPSDLEKIRAIYEYVSARYRYIGVSLGLGRYTPHASTEVFANQYGDCKDKHTVFAALLQAAGIRSYPALISSVTDAYPGIPSPAVFDHVITAIPQGSSFLFLDTTPEIAPMGVLGFKLRDKYALVISDPGPVQLLKTPADPPFPNSQRFKMDATLDEKGTLEGKVRMESRGDLELIQRQLFQRTGQTDWKDLVQKMSYSMGFQGTVSEVSAARADDETSAFWFAYSYRRLEIGDWQNHRFTLPVPSVGMPPMEDDKVISAKSFPLGSPVEIHFESHIRLPADYAPILPPPVHLRKNFAEYESTYSFENGVLHGTRRLALREREVPATERAAYKAFTKSVEDDELRFVVLGPSLPTTGAKVAGGDTDVDQNIGHGRELLNLGAPFEAITYLERAVTLDPNSSQAWFELAKARTMARQTEAAVLAYRKAISLDPSLVSAYRSLAAGLASLDRETEAIEAWRNLLKVAPDDKGAPVQLGNLLFKTKKYAEACAAYEGVIARDPENAGIHFLLGRAYLRVPEEAKAVSEFEKAMKLQPSAEMLNSVAYDLAEANERLPQAFRYAEEAVKQTEEETSRVQLDAADIIDYRRMTALAAEWDTLGWVKYKMGDMETAEKYVRAAWVLMQARAVGEHLRQIYVRRGKKEEAARVLAMTQALPGGHAQKQRGPTSKRGPQVDLNTLRLEGRAATELSEMRTVHLGSVALGAKSAEFSVALVKGSKVVEVLFVHGDEDLRSATKALTNAKYKFEFPDEGPTKIIAHGVVSCSAPTKQCLLVLYPPPAFVALDSAPVAPEE